MSQFIDFDNTCSQPFELYENLNVINKSDQINKIGNFKENKLSISYFSKENIDFLQNTMISEIYKLTKGTRISKQSDIELKIIMKSIYLQYGRNMDTNIEEQVQELNKRVLDYSIDNINSNLKQYNQYIKDITSEQTIMEMPQNVHIKGEKTLLPKHFF